MSEKSQKEAELKVAEEKRDKTYQKIYDIQYNEYPQKDTAALNLKTDSVGGLPLGELKDGLNNTADKLDSIKNTLRNMGYKDEDIQKVINYVGVDPERLADNIRDVAKEVKPQMSYNDLVIYKAALELRLAEAKADEEKMKNTAAKERAEVSKYDADIQKANDEKSMHNENRKGHDKLADDYDAECRRDWPTCTWNIPKAAWERSMAAMDQGHMNRVDAWIKILNFGKMFPAMVVAQSDLKAAPYAYTRQIIEKQISEVDTAKTDLHAKINDEIKKASEERNTKLAPLQTQYAAEHKVVTDLEEELRVINFRIADVNAVKPQKEWSVKAALELVTGRVALLAQLESELAQLEGSKSVQALADPQELQKKADAMKMEVAQAKDRAAQAKVEFNEWVKQNKREEKVEDSGKKPLPMIRPAVAIDLEKKIQPQLNTRTQQENNKRIQFQNRLEAARLTNERELAHKKEPLDRELAQKDQEVAELKKKADQAYQEMQAALQKKQTEEAAKKTQEELAKKQAEEEASARQKAIEEATKQRQQEEAMQKQREIEKTRVPAEQKPVEQKAEEKKYCDPELLKVAHRHILNPNNRQPKERHKKEQKFATPTSLAIHSQGVWSNKRLGFPNNFFEKFCGLLLI
ncbi:MAG: hypothetical protein HYY61_01815 [Deltaproteobacteria bacterium]|nr:hypothetical protein [Deltaproteobacteria bacterium]